MAEPAEGWIMPRTATAIEKMAFRSLDDARQLVPAEINLSKDDMLGPHDVMWRSEDKPIVAATEDLISLLPFYRDDAISDHNIKNLNEQYFRKYLRMNNVRIANLVDCIKDRLKPNAKILEIGSFFGSFALALQRLGYQVTAVDRYDEFKGRFDKHIELMEDAGIAVVRTNKETEVELISSLGKFDATIAMAVIEHVPHTPKSFLHMMKAATKRGGSLAIDTPNIARYWNRKRLAEGKTIFQPLEDQFECIPPWEGHHREYTGEELSWMLERIGCVDARVKRFDYNMLQFEYIDRPHIECLEACINDPAQGDTILAAGTVIE